MARPALDLRYPFEYFAAPLAFASTIAEVTGMPLWEAVSRYTPLREEISGALFLDRPDEDAWGTILQGSAGKSPQQIAGDIYALYLRQPHARFQAEWVPRGSTRFGSLGVDTSDYNLSRDQVKLHFLPTRKGGSDLASSRIAERRADMQRLLLFVKDTHPDIRYFTSYTWLQNLPNYRALFPPSFLDRLVVMRDRFLGLWGQFVKWDGTANHTNYTRFLQALQRATTLDEVIDAIPLKVLGAVGPIDEFYAWYAIR